MSGSAGEQASSPNDYQQNPELELIPRGERRVLPFLHPNLRQYAVGEKEGLPSGAQWQWRSRDNRKGRHLLILPRAQAPSRRARTARFLQRLVRMVTVFAWWDISWWVGIFFTVGSAMFIASGVIYWLPIAHSSKTYPYDPIVVGGALSFVGATLFELGGILLVVEALNANQAGCFGWALEKVVEDEKKKLESHRSEISNEENGSQLRKHSEFRPDKGDCTHIHNYYHRKKHGFVKAEQPRAEGQPTPSQDWKWWPTWHELRTHYLHEIGFNANLILFVGATVFWVTSLLALPGIYNNLSQGVLWGVYWLTFFIGGICFVVSSLLYILEAQEKWFKPAPKVVGWWVGVWNTVGSVGWTWSAALGYCSKHWCEYQSELALIWAASAFLVASVLLIYEVVEKWPVRVEGDKKHRS